MPINDFIIARMQELMRARGLSRYGLAQLSDYPRSSLFSYLQGKRQVPMLFVVDFCTALGIRVSDFFAGYEG